MNTAMPGVTVPNDIGSKSDINDDPHLRGRPHVGQRVFKIEWTTGEITSRHMRRTCQCNLSNSDEEYWFI